MKSIVPARKLQIHLAPTSQFNMMNGYSSCFWIKEFMQQEKDQWTLTPLRYTYDTGLSMFIGNYLTHLHAIDSASTILSDSTFSQFNTSYSIYSGISIKELVIELTIGGLLPETPTHLMNPDAPSTDHISLPPVLLTIGITGIPDTHNVPRDFIIDSRFPAVEQRIASLTAQHVNLSVINIQKMSDDLYRLSSFKQRLMKDLINVFKQLKNTNNNTL
eukprot:CAMPEP_0117425422 /NCGR_PEP_ID=MMETSP0758-20121206/5678_1 /TAXON_ID=63605 /ORGANISM="Percolomonas cosmopolitus, Strain AE-1 (ATCC 50343)" /LENGTH=216 /DNA_ID=CAMNT_0005209859 /DNA_START=851 /DNA_END=1498 /DNA_ORIENTATION=+